MPKALSFPLTDADVLGLYTGDSVLLNGTIITARDTAHKWIYDRFISKVIVPTSEDFDIYNHIKRILQGGAIFHCGPVVRGLDSHDYRFVSAGPTTSIREEPYQGEVMRHFNLKGIIGKGGMENNTLKACGEVPGVYFHAVGGAGALIAQSVEHVIDVYKLEFGVPEAMWVIRIKNFPAIVTMDAHGKSLHKAVKNDSGKKLNELLSR
jgi:fumarate hydratase class I